MENKTPNQNPIKPTGKFPKFNISWIYGIIILVLLGSYFFNENTPTKEVPFTTFKEYVKQGMIVKVNVFNSKNAIEAQLIDYSKITKDTASLSKTFGEKYKSLALTPKVLKDSLTKRDTQTLKKVYGDKFDLYSKDRLITVSVPAEEFSRFIQTAEDKYGFKGSVEYKESRNYFDVFLYSVLPILLLVLFFVFMNRRMSGQTRKSSVYSNNRNSSNFIIGH